MRHAPILEGLSTRLACTAVEPVHVLREQDGIDLECLGHPQSTLQKRRFQVQRKSICQVASKLAVLICETN
jgi:hypothetical protein